MLKKLAIIQLYIVRAKNIKKNLTEQLCILIEFYDNFVEQVWAKSKFYLAKAPKSKIFNFSLHQNNFLLNRLTKPLIFLTDE